MKMCLVVSGRQSQFSVSEEKAKEKAKPKAKRKQQKNKKKRKIKKAKMEIRNILRHRNEKPDRTKGKIIIKKKYETDLSIKNVLK